MVFLSVNFPFSKAIGSIMMKNMFSVGRHKNGLGANVTAIHKINKSRPKWQMSSSERIEKVWKSFIKLFCHPKIQGRNTQKTTRKFMNFPLVNKRPHNNGRHIVWKWPCDLSQIGGRQQFLFKKATKVFFSLLLWIVLKHTWMLQTHKLPKFLLPAHLCRSSEDVLCWITVF